MGFFSGILGNAFGSVASSIGGSLLDKVVGGSDSGGGALGSVANIAGPLVGGILSNKSQSEANDLNYQLAQAQLQFQQEYAKNRLQWQVEDAKKAGLHPMVAAGLSPTSFSPVSAGQSGLNYDWVSQIGQNLDYAATKAKTTQQQAQAFAFAKASNELTLESLRLDNDIKRMEIMSMASRLSNSGPSAPSSGKSGAVVEGQGDSVKIVPDEVIATGPNSSVTAGTHPLWTHARSGDFVMPVLSGNIADAVTENKEKNVSAEVSYALSAWNGSLKPPMNAFTAKEKNLLKSGEYSAYYYPFMGWRVEPTLSWKNFKKFVLGGFKK